ncbi:vacuolar protein sorting-associated protein 41 homolog isoform X2 [Folsomia candida]|uniref:vacuolar protein sorting-associated protein 41 homolog isoform X2 n=1 Tax=Folsomia candida TaxID=158441 RepID=UPI001604EF40|nr:vacuolar protein sorting-associated protein 41 homolog isoform X2 [Folsomia candida]
MVGDERDKGMSSMEDYDDFESGSLGDSASLDGVDDDEDEEDDEEEPKLNFIRIRNDLLGILEKDAVSCVAVHSKFLCIGSHRGELYIMDHLGNNVTPSPRGSFPAHKIMINCISIDAEGEHIATCSDDGKVIVFNLCDGHCETTLSLDKKLRCVAIDPQYSKSSFSRRFLVGSDSAMLYQRNIFNLLKPFPILEGGIVSTIKWGSRFVAWSWKDEVRIYDIEEEIMISRVRFEWESNNLVNNSLIEPSSLHMSSNGSKENLIKTLHEKYRCNIFWKDKYTVFIGWADIIKICQVVEIKNKNIQPGAPSHYVKISCMFTTDFWTCGISSFSNYTTVLSLTKEFMAIGNGDTNNEYAKNNNLPNVQILETDTTSYNVLQADALRTRGYTEYKPLDYHLESLIDEILFFIVSPKDIILAKARDQDDHIQWLMERKKFEEALEVAIQDPKSLQRHSVMNVGLAYLDHLVENEMFADAGKLCFKLFGKESPEKWEEQVLRFVPHGQLRAIAPYLPRGESSKLQPYFYEMILYDYLKNDQSAFLGLIREWNPPPELFNVTTIINAVVDHLIIYDPENRFLLQALADLYSYQKKFGKALAMYLKLQDPQVFSLIQRYGLYEEIESCIEDLMHLNVSEAINLFMKHKERLTPSIVISRLEGNRYYQYLYLDVLYKGEGKDMKPEFNGMMVSLYADYGPSYLLQFLKSSDSYPIQEALDICKQRKLYAEMIFLLGRMGNTKEALRLIIYVLDDIYQAIDFCKEHDDTELWEDLINFSLDKPSYITILLCNIGTYVDPRILIQKIENGREIPGLRDCLVKILQDYNLQMELQEGCKNILVGDCLSLFQTLVRTQLKGACLEDQECGSCHKGILVGDNSGEDSNLLYFFCKHIFHVSCISSFDYQNCIICNLPRRATGLLEKL